MGEAEGGVVEGAEGVLGRGGLSIGHVDFGRGLGDEKEREGDGKRNNEERR